MRMILEKLIWKHISYIKEIEEYEKIKESTSHNVIISEKLTRIVLLLLFKKLTTVIIIQ